MTKELERKIVNALNKDARKSFRKLAKEVGSSAPVVINKIKELEKAGAIKGYVPIVDSDYFGYELMALIAIRISHGKLLETQKRIAKDPHLFAIYDITGEWDSIAIGRFKNRDDLNQFVKKILAERYIERTITHIVLNVVKDECRVEV